MTTLKTFSSASTKKLGREFAKRIMNDESGITRKSAFVIALSGDLGAGKTTFVQGFFRGLGIKTRAVSPTFIIFRKFKIPHSKFKLLYHVDAYRIKQSSDMAVLGFKDILADKKNILLIEWAENIKKILPKDASWIRFKHGKKEHERTLTFSKNLSLGDTFL